jgi:glycosyltransferase involved in cell wall biosynthesis
MTLANGISVILPVHGSGQYLEKALHSVMSQQVNEPMEIVVALDRPADRVLKMLQKYSSKNLRLITVDEPGVAHAHNAALLGSRFDLVAVAHSDDVMLPDRLASQSAVMRRNSKLVAIGGQLRLISDAGCTIGVSVFPVGIGKSRFCSRFMSPIAHAAAMFRTHVAWEIGGYRQEFAPAEDYDLWMRMLDVGEIDNLSSLVTEYRKHHGQVSAGAKNLQAEMKAKIVLQATSSTKIYRIVPPDTDKLLKDLIRADVALHALAEKRLYGDWWKFGLRLIKTLVHYPKLTFVHGLVFLEGRLRLMAKRR